MKCSQAHKFIGDRLDGGLGPEDNERLREHLASCPDCRDLLKDFQKIVEQAKDLPKHEPSNRAWTAILSGVRAAGREPSAVRMPKPKWREIYIFTGRAKYAWAAALFLVVVGGIAVGLFRPGKDLSGPSEQDRYTLAKLEEAEKHYKLAIRALNDAIGSQKNGLDPQVAAVFSRNLREIDTAIQACQNAVSKEPNSLEAREYLLGAYKDKVAFLDNIIDVKKIFPSGKTAGSIL
jgi:tetratricopeptide (TPR) repeat protein